MAVDILGVERNYASLSTRDLLEARDQYHWHLIHKRNVVGTAIGLYLIRKSDPWPTAERPDAVLSKAPPPPKGERTFENSEVRDYSWPCVLVLVDRWQYPGDFGSGPGQLHPEEMVPTTLYMVDGRTVPVCVVKVTRAAPDQRILPSWHWPEGIIGGGFPIISETQGQQRIASVGALVTDGHSVYALTSRHVAGPAGHAVSTLLRGHAQEIGKSSDRQLTRLPFNEVYPEFTARRTFLTLDAGLIEVADLNRWTSQVYGLPPVGPLADLSERNIGTRLINAEVVAYGAASGELRGRIAALFFRHRSIGGYDDVTDFLIAPEPGTPHSEPGDSGTVWHLRQKLPEEPLRPIALQWGGQTFLFSSGEQTFNFALASGLTNVLRLLDVELVVEHNTGAQPYWGKTGHYTISTLACDHVTSTKLKKLMTANRDRVSFPIAELDANKIDEATKTAKKQELFVPLADVADVIWKNVPKNKGGVTGGRDTSPNKGPEHPTHFANIDEPRASDAKTLRQICIEDSTNVDVAVWQAFYHDLGHDSSEARGLLPFRIWQFFDAMVDALEANDLTAFVCAAGLMAHYVGDACQTLHGSIFFNGLPDGTGHGVHKAYETSMIDHRTKDAELLNLITASLATLPAPATVSSGKGAAVATIALMDRTAQAVDALDLVNTYAGTQGGVSKAVTTILWDKFGDGTAQAMADGVLTLAMLWQSAWKKANGDTRFTTSQMVAMNTDSLRTLYIDKKFIESLDLSEIATVLQT